MQSNKTWMVAHRWAGMASRVLMALLFLISAYGKVTAAAVTESFMKNYGVPGVLLWPAAAWEFFAGLCLLFGVFPRLISVGLAAWCLLTAAIFHTDWSNPIQFAHFFKNMTMAGAFIALAIQGLPGPVFFWSRVVVPKDA